MAIKILNMNSELGAGTRGASLGTAAVKIASLNKRSDYFKKHPMKVLPDLNDELVNGTNTPYAKNIEHIARIYETTADAVKATIDGGEFPVVLSGDHSTAGASIAGLKMAHPDKRVGVVWVDAHGDLHSPYSSPSGNVHGMPLATALGHDNEERKINDIDEETKKYWEQLKNVGGICPKFNPEDLVFFGVRDTEEPEDFIMKKHNIPNYRVEEVRYRGLDTCVDEAIEKLRHCDIIYITFDVDSMDCDLISKGTGTPVSKGFDDKEVTHIMKKFIETGKVGCFEMVEVNPTLDEKQNKMAETAFDVLEELTPAIENNL
ncbi:arginase [Salibacter sp.]|uniref:arginase n=1 Tax=Salibacter sp. TaxID=2010995 RepID=UPI0028709CC9|nr:arginase [Salibacter sp.]MDR9398851.1 arginase [Salibacter sp.]MDR9487328.1 arginase [Salibacter sp.]